MSKMTWYKVAFTHNDLITQRHMKVLTAMSECLIEHRSPQGLALFSTRYEPFASTTYFLSPNSAEYCPELLETCGVEPCSAPDPDSISVLCGRSDDKEFWFPLGRDH